jgi:hypothetical protein
MKKRKKPIFLIAVLVLIGGGAIAMNSNLLSTPKTAEDIQKDAEIKQAAELAKNPPKPAATAKLAAKDDKNTPGMAGAQDDGSLVRPKEGDEGMGTNIHAVPAVKAGDPKINAPLEIPNQQKRFDRTGTQVQGQWYRPESGSNQIH